MRGRGVEVSKTLFYIEKTDNLVNSIFTDKGKMTYDMIETMKYGYE